MRKVFIDCGAHNGCSVRMFRSLYDSSREYEVFSFEPNPVTAALFNEDGVEFQQKAITATGDTITLYIHTNDSYACTTYEEKGKMPNCGSPKPGATVTEEVESIRLSEFIKNNFSKEDYIVLKLDIEGEEYNVIPDLIKTKATDYINELYLEWHSRWLNKSSDIDEELEEKISSLGIKIKNDWNAAGC